MNERLSKAEIRKDAIQDGVEAATAAVGQVTNIVVGAVGEVAKAVGGLATDIFEIKDAAQRAQDDAVDDSAPVSADDATESPEI
jgi:hypothetical protein